MKKIEIMKAYVEANMIHYEVREEKGLGLLQQEVVKLFVQFHGDENYDYDLSKVPQSILLLSLSLYMVPITYFYNVELVIPEMDKILYERLSSIYEAYSKIYGPFKNEWRGKISVIKIIENRLIESAKYDKVVFFSGGVDARHAGIDNPGRRTLLVSIPDIEALAKNYGSLREEKFSLIKDFSNIINSDWLLISNNFNTTLFKDRDINKYLKVKRGLSSIAYKFDGWFGIKYIANMCCVAPIAYLAGIKSMIMGSAFEPMENKPQAEQSGGNHELSNSIGFANTIFAEQDALMVRRSRKVQNIIDWCKLHEVKMKLQVCFCDDSTQCGYCRKCVRTQLNILCIGENPKEWGFDNFSEKLFSKHIMGFHYVDTSCWLWDIIDTIDDDKIYPYCNDLLHWLKDIGYKEYEIKADKKTKLILFFKRLKDIKKYPHYVKVVISKLMGGE